MLDSFHSTVRTWFQQELGEPTRAQFEAWPAIARGEHTLLLAPAGSRWREGLRPGTTGSTVHTGFRPAYLSVGIPAAG